MITDKKYKRTVNHVNILERKIFQQKTLIRNFHNLVATLLRDGVVKKEEVKKYIKKKQK